MPESRRVGFNLIGHLSMGIGTGEVGRDVLTALARHGRPVRGIDVQTNDERSGRIPGWTDTFGDWSGVEREIDWVQVNIAAMDEDLREQFYPPAPEKPRPLVNMTFWELPRFPSRWVERFNDLDAVVAPTRFIEDALKDSGVQTPILYMPQSIDPGELLPADRARFGLPEDGILFLSAFDVNSDPSRKNPMGAIEAFETAFPPGSGKAQLVIKIGHAEIHAHNAERVANLKARAAANPDIILWWDWIAVADLRAFYACFDAFISLHRSEGLGLILMEMMSLAKPVLATAFSGNLDFCTSDNSLLVGCDLVPVEATEPLYNATAAEFPDCRWAEPRIDEAAAALRRCVEDPEHVRALGVQARQDMLSRRNHDHTALFEAIENLAANRGNENRDGNGVDGNGDRNGNGNGNKNGNGNRDGEPEVSFGGEQETGGGTWGERWARFKRERLGLDFRLFEGRKSEEPEPAMNQTAKTREDTKATSEKEEPQRFDNQALAARGMKAFISPEPLAQPTELDYFEHKMPDLRHLKPRARNDDKVLLILVPHLRANIFYAGYNIFFDAFASVGSAFDRVLVCVFDELREVELLAGYHERVEICGEADLASKLTCLPAVTGCINAFTHWAACQALPAEAEILYYCLENDAVFFVPGPMHYRVLRSLRCARNLVVSTGLMASMLHEEGVLHPEARVVVTSPNILPLRGVRPRPESRTLFMYFRPEGHNIRNMAAEVMRAAEAFAEKHAGEGWDLYLVGTLGMQLSRKVAGNTIWILPKLPKAEYESIAAQARAAVALIAAPHPGVLAYQFAASGIPTVTNVYGNRTAEVLQEMSKNFVPYDPSREDLIDALERALRAPHGIPDFHGALYDGRDLDLEEPRVRAGSFGAFVRELVGG